jgi:hypothetical protein
MYADYPESCRDDLLQRKRNHSGDYAAFVALAGLADDLKGYYFVKEHHYGTLTVSGLCYSSTLSDRSF